MTAKFKETEIGLIPEDWELISLKNLTNKIGSGATPRGGSQVYVERGVSFIRSQNVRDEGFKNDLVYINDDAAGKLNNVELFPKDVLLNITGDSICRTSIVPDEVLPGRVNQHVAIIRANAKLYYKFLFFYLCSDVAKWRLLSYDAGGTRKAITKSTLEHFTIPLPKYEEQMLIADLLDSFNKKIHFNHQMNQTLEKIGQTIFRHWFVHFEFPDENGQPYKSSGGEMVNSELGDIPKGWKLKPLDEVAKYLNGLALQNYPPKNDFLPVIKIRELKQGITSQTDKASSDIPKEYIINDGDVIFSWSGSLEVVIWANGKGALNQHLFKVTSEEYPKWFYYYQTLRFLPSFRQTAADKATTMGHIKRSHLSESLIAAPPENILKQADKILNPIIEKIILNKINSRYLASIRDFILPKLMSGKIRLNIPEEATAK